VPLHEQKAKLTTAQIFFFYKKKGDGTLDLRERSQVAAQVSCSLRQFCLSHVE